jgi:hypothetical protein
VLREFSFAGLLVSPMVVCVLIAALLTAMTLRLIPGRLEMLQVRPAWLGLAIFTGYTAAALSILDGGLK